MLKGGLCVFGTAVAACVLESSKSGLLENARTERAGAEIACNATCISLTSHLAVSQAGLTPCLLLTTQSAEAAFGPPCTQLH